MSSATKGAQGCFIAVAGRQLPRRKLAAAVQPHQAGSQLAPATQKQHLALRHDSLVQQGPDCARQYQLRAVLMRPHTATL